MAIEIIRVETGYQGWGRYLVATVRMPDGQTFRREIEDHGAAVGILPYDPERRTATLVRQFRAPVLHVAKIDHTLEVVAGLLEEPDPAAAARREAMEETGLRVGPLEEVATVWTMPGISTERMTLYLAAYREADRVGEGGGLAAENETITVVEMPLAELAAMADTGRLVDMKTLLLVQTLRLRHPALFAE